MKVSRFVAEVGQTWFAFRCPSLRRQTCSGPCRRQTERDARLDYKQYKINPTINKRFSFHSTPDTVK